MMKRARESDGRPARSTLRWTRVRRRSLPALKALALAAAVAAFSSRQAEPSAVVVPFDGSRSAVGLNVTVKGTPLYVLLDTGVDPSLIDLARADALGLKVDRGDGGEASGFGGGRGATVFPSSIEGLAIGGRGFARFDALAADLGGLSAHYGRRLDGVLGYSFLSDKVVLIDYPGSRLGVFSRAGQAAPMTARCRVRWTAPLRTLDGYPVIPGFRLGRARGPVTLDTGSNGSLGLFPGALELPGVKAALSVRGTVTHSGARGAATTTSYAFMAPVGFGPFTLPPGQPAIVHTAREAGNPRVANVGNALFAAMRLNVLLDYRGKTLAFYGGCP